MSGQRVLDELEAFAYLTAHGVPVVRHALAASLPEAVKAAAAIGYPVALKLSSGELAHKTEAGGVRLGIRDAGDLAEAWPALLAAASARGLALGGDLRGMLVEEMVRGGAELIVGGLRDAAFGPVVMFGLGGVLAELVSDASFRLAPVDAGEARRMVGETRAGRLLAGFRGGPPLPEAPLVATIVRVSELMAAEPHVLELDINPLLLTPAGGQAADALVRLAEYEEDR
jgi:succinyl-CoA synthetase beta subunit